MTLEDVNKKMSTLLLQEEEYKLLIEKYRNNLANIRKSLKKLKSQRFKLTRVGEGEDRVCTCCNNTYPATSEYYPIKRRYKSGKVGFRGRCKVCYNKHLKDTGKNKRNYNPEYQKVYTRRAIKGLKDNYIKSLIRQSHDIPYKSITPEVIEEKRNIVKLKRLIHDKTRAI